MINIMKIINGIKIGARRITIGMANMKRGKKKIPSIISKNIANKNLIKPKAEIFFIFYPMLE